MTIDKLPSGSYRVRMTINGKQEAVTFKHNPTEYEIMMAFSKKVNTPLKGDHITFGVAANEYCKIKKNVLSPASYRGYKSICRMIPDYFNNIYINEITDKDILSYLNTIASDHKPKTVKNYYDFIIPVIRLYRKDYNAENVTLPKIMQEKLYIPTDEELHKLFSDAKVHENGMYYCAIVLGSYGMRRSELVCIGPDDIKNNVVYIKRAKILTDDGEWIIKDYPKTSKSIRQIPIPSEIADIINEQGYAYNGHPGSITKYIEDWCKKNNVQKFTLHKLRHYFCSRLRAENIDVKTILSLSGHKTPSVFERVYLHEIDEKVQEASNKLESILFTN